MAVVTYDTMLLQLDHKEWNACKIKSLHLIEVLGKCKKEGNCNCNYDLKLFKTASKAVSSYFCAINQYSQLYNIYLGQVIWDKSFGSHLGQIIWVNCFN